MSKVVRQTAKSGAPKAVSVVTPRFKAAEKKAASHILSAPKGYRTLTHREVEQAVKKVFRERHAADA